MNVATIVLEARDISRAFPGVQALAGVDLTLRAGDVATARSRRCNPVRHAFSRSGLLSGGAGYLAGTLFGVLILGIIQTLIAFDRT